jgi:hypothetical protein
MHTNPRGRIYTSASGRLLLVPALLGLGYSWSIGGAVAFMVLFGPGWGLFDGNNMPLLYTIPAPAWRASGYGFMNLVSISVGAAATVALLSAGLILFLKPRAYLKA